MLKKYSLKALELAINKAMNLDEQMADKLQAFNDKTIEMIINPLNVHFFIHFKEAKIILLDRYNDQADTIIHSSPIGLIRLSLLPASKARSLFNDKIRISGDMELGQKVKKLFDEMDIDWEGHLAHFTGDVVAYQVGSFVRKGISFTQQFDQSIRQSLTEYLQEELSILPTNNELDDFFTGVDELSLSVERLQAHMNQIISRHEIH